MKFWHLIHIHTLCPDANNNNSCYHVSENCYDWQPMCVSILQAGWYYYLNPELGSILIRVWFWVSQLEYWCTCWFYNVWILLKHDLLYLKKISQCPSCAYYTNPRLQFTEEKAMVWELWRQQTSMKPNSKTRISKFKRWFCDRMWIPLTTINILQLPTYLKKLLNAPLQQPGVQL